MFNNITKRLQSLVIKSTIFTRPFIIILLMRYGCTEPWKKICLFHFTIMGLAILKLKSRLKSTANLSTILCFWIIEVDFNKLVCTERVGKVKKFAELYGCDRGRVKGLVFCSRKEEAKRLSQEFNKLDY